MPLPSPNKNESKKKFLERCMGNPTMNEEYPDTDQRYAVCQSKWSDKKSKSSLVVEVGDDEMVFEKEI